MKKKVLYTIPIITILLIIVYFSSIFFTKDEFPKNTYINNINVSGMTLLEVDNALSQLVTWDNLVINGNDIELGNIKSADINYKYVSNTEIKNILSIEGLDYLKWLKFKDKHYNVNIQTSYDENKLKTIIGEFDWINKDSKNSEIVYSEKDKIFKIEPEIYGIKISKDKLYDLVKQSIDEKNSNLVLDEFIEKPEITSTNPELVASIDTMNKYLNVVITYNFGDQKEVVDKSLIKDWIVINDKNIDLDFDKIRTYEDSLSKKYNTYGKSRDFTTSYGDKIKISGGSYGWLIHRTDSANALIDAIKSGEDKTIEPVYSYKASVKGTDDIGNSYVEISLEKQMVWMYIDGELKVETSTVTGNVSAGHATPPGIFPLNYKQKGAILRGPGYASPVDYWMPFNGGIGLHDATWRSSFGGTIYKTSGSHGCINLPLSKAKEIYNLIYPGMPVIVY